MFWARGKFCRSAAKRKADSDVRDSFGILISSFGFEIVKFGFITAPNSPPSLWNKVHNFQTLMQIISADRLGKKIRVVTVSKPKVTQSNIMKLHLVIVGVGCLFMQAAYAQQTLPFYDPFNYTEGLNLDNVGGPWTVHGASGGGSPLVTSAAALTYTGLTPGSGLGVSFGTTASGTRNAAVNFTTANSGTLYASFLLDVTTAPTGNRQLAFLTSDSTASANANANGIFLNSSMQLGISKASSATPGVLDTLSPLSLNTTYLLVVGYTFNGTGNEYDLWLNPTSLGGSAPAASISLTTGTDMSSLSYFFVQQRNNVSNFGSAFYMDELRIGTSWADVTPAVDVPEPTSFALAGLGGLALVLVRRMRR